MVAFDVLILGGDVDSVADLADALSELGHVYLLPPAAAVARYEGETVGFTTDHFRIHVAEHEAIAALDAMHVYRKLFLPDTLVVAEVSKIAIVAL
jgi:hypothetical protein